MKTTTLLIIIACTSCASVNSWVTKTPIPSTPVSRADGVPFNVAIADVVRAETEPTKVWGLYDAKGLVDLVDNRSGK